MKTKTWFDYIHIIALAALVFALGIIFTQHAVAQTDTTGGFHTSSPPGPTITADPSTIVPTEAQNLVLTFFLHIAVAHPWVATFLSVMVFFRVWAKPISSVIHAIVDLTPSKTDDGVLNSILTWLHTPFGSFLCYLFDWITSIKIHPPTSTVAPTGSP